MLTKLRRILQSDTEEMDGIPVITRGMLESKVQTRQYKLTLHIKVVTLKWHEIA